MKREPFLFTSRSILVVAIALFVIFSASAQIGESPDGSGRAQARASSAGTFPNRRSVLLELMTTEECDECEAARQIASELEQAQPAPNDQIILLNERLTPFRPEEHLSSSNPTRRQAGYDSLGDDSHPSPVFAVNGLVQPAHVGKTALEASIATDPSDLVPLKIASVEVARSTISFTLETDSTTPGYIDVYVALVRPTKLSDVLATTRYDLVRTFARVGSSFRAKALGNKPFFLDSHAPDTAALNGMRLVVFVQTKHIGPVLGVTSCMFELGASAAPASSALPCPVVSSK